MEKVRTIKLFKNYYKEFYVAQTYEVRDKWKSRARLTPEGKATVTPENLLFLTPLKS